MSLKKVMLVLYASVLAFSVSTVQAVKLPTVSCCQRPEAQAVPLRLSVEHAEELCKLVPRGTTIYLRDHPTEHRYAHFVKDRVVKFREVCVSQELSDAIKGFLSTFQFSSWEFSTERIAISRSKEEHGKKFSISVHQVDCCENCLRGCLYAGVAFQLSCMALVTTFFLCVEQPVRPAVVNMS